MVVVGRNLAVSSPIESNKGTLSAGVYGTRSGRGTGPSEPEWDLPLTTASTIVMKC